MSFHSFAVLSANTQTHRDREEWGTSGNERHLREILSLFSVLQMPSFVAAREDFNTVTTENMGEDKGQGKCPRFLFCCLGVLCELGVGVFFGCGQRLRCVSAPLGLILHRLPDLPGDAR